MYATRYGSNQHALLEASYNIEISHVASLAIILSRKQITQVLTRLQRFAGWLALLLFQCKSQNFLMHTQVDLLFQLYENLCQRIVHITTEQSTLCYETLFRPFPIARSPGTLL